jgi:hypothetical protein
METVLLPNEPLVRDGVANLQRGVETVWQNYYDVFILFDTTPKRDHPQDKAEADDWG